MAIKEKYPAEIFRAWLDHMRDEDGSLWSKSRAARELGCGRNQILEWSRDGAPYYIGLACQTLWERKGYWKSPHRPKPKTEKKSTPGLPPETLRALRLKSVPWTKADPPA